MNMDMKLQQKCALVTGSTSGIGEAIAKTLAEEGVKVVVHGRREAEAKRVMDFAIGDIATDAGVEQVAEAAIQAFGGVDILVNNAGTYPAKGWFTESPADWNDVL
jgi:3-oxoacyl-[acyl-carrier protein] reductase